MGEMVEVVSVGEDGDVVLTRNVPSSCSSLHKSYQESCYLITEVFGRLGEQSFDDSIGRVSSVG